MTLAAAKRDRMGKVELQDGEDPLWMHQQDVTDWGIDGLVLHCTGTWDVNRVGYVYVFFFFGPFLRMDATRGERSGRRDSGG